MKFGVSFLPDAMPDVKSGEDYFRDALALSKFADEQGLEYAKMTEHYLRGYGGYCPSPPAFLTAVAAITKNIRLMSGCILPAFHHPVQTAAECAMVDAISHGRFDAGFARAYMPYEFDCFHIELDESRARFEKSVEAIVRLWTEADVTIETPFFSFQNANSLPPVTQRPHPPIWIAAVRSRQSFAWIGEQGYNLMVTSSITSQDGLAENIRIYREAFAEEREGRGEVIISIPLFLAPTDAEAVELGDRHLSHYFQVWSQSAESWDHASSRDYPGYTRFLRALLAQTPESIRADLGVLFGSPERVAEQIQLLKERLDVDHFMWQVDFGAMNGELAMRTLTLFCDQVRHHLSGA